MVNQCTKFEVSSVGLEKAAAVTSAAVGGCRGVARMLPVVVVAVVIADSAVI